MELCASRELKFMYRRLVWEAAKRRAEDLPDSENPFTLTQFPLISQIYRYRILRDKWTRWRKNLTVKFISVLKLQAMDRRQISFLVLSSSVINRLNK